MARKRFLSPDIWSDPFITKLSFQERLLFIGMITLADDEGRLRMEPSYLRGEIFPRDDLTDAQVATMIDRITRRTRNIQRYQSSSSRYAVLKQWGKYQAPSHPTPSRLPAPPRFKNGPNPPESFAKDSREDRDLGRGVGVGRGGGSGRGEELRSSLPPYSPPKGGQASSSEIRRVCLEAQDDDAVELWQKALATLQGQVTKPNYETWLKTSAGYALNGSKFVVVAPNDFAAEWLSTKLRAVISKTLTGLLGKPTEVEFVLAEDE